MRKLLIVIILLWTPLKGNSQLQIPFPDTLAEWGHTQVIFADPSSSGSQDQYCDFKYYPYGKTTIDTIEFINLYYANDFSWPLNQNFDFNSGVLFGYYRIDNKKIYFKSPNLNIGLCYGVGYSNYVFQTWDEILLYDFDLVVGDTFAVKNNTNIIVESVDSVSIQGVNYKRINFEPTNFSSGNYSWIEGIGSSFGFFPYYNFFERAIFFNCFYENDDDLNYEADIAYYADYGNCPYTAELDELDFKVKIYPNPTSNEFSINVPAELIGKKYKVLDVSGRELLNGTIEQPATLINLKFFDEGSYFISIEGRIKSIKISKI